MDEMIRTTARHLAGHVAPSLVSAWRRPGWSRVVGAALVARIPDRFEAEARVYVDTKSVLRPLMRGLAVEPDLDQTIGMLGRTLITRPNVEGLVKQGRVVAQRCPAGGS